MGVVKRIPCKTQNQVKSIKIRMLKLFAVIMDIKRSTETNVRMIQCYVLGRLSPFPSFPHLCPSGISGEKHCSLTHRFPYIWQGCVFLAGDSNLHVFFLPLMVYATLIITYLPVSAFNRL